MRPSLLSFVLPLTLVAVVAAQDLSPALRRRAVNFSRPGWVVVDGRFARPQATLAEDELFALKPAGERLTLLARPGPAAEPLLRAGRVTLVRLGDDGSAWTLACRGRTWNDNRSAGTQHLQLVRVAGPAPGDDGKPTLVRIDVAPTQQAVEALVRDGGVEKRVVLVTAGDFVEAAVGVDPARPELLLRAATFRRLLTERPTDVRRYVLPVLRRLNHDRNPLAPGAADVYRAFPGLPTDPAARAGVAKTLADLASPDPAARRTASVALADLGPRGVQALALVDAATLDPEAAERVATVLAEASHDPRPPEQLRADPDFLLDCLSDPDPNVRVAAGRYVGTSATPAGSR